MADRPRLLLVITLAEVGGAQSYVAQLLPALAPSFDVAVAAHGPGPLRDASDAAGVRFVSLHHVRRAVNPWRDLLGLWELYALFRRERPHIVHANSSKAGVLARLAAALARVPIRMFTAHGWAFSAHSGSASSLYRLADRLVRPLTTQVICVAESERAAGLRAGTCRSDRTVVIPNAVDVAAHPRATPVEAVPLLVSVGRLKAPKDFSTLVRAVARLEPRSWRLIIVGDGPERPALERQLHAEGLDDAVEFVGERSDVSELLAGADAFVLSSRSEGMPLSVLEAMAAGLPVVATAVGGVPEVVVHDETGVLVAPGDAEALAAALARLIDDPELRRRLGSAGRSRAARHFDLPRFRQAHVELYRAELAERGLPAPA